MNLYDIDLAFALQELRIRQTIWQRPTSAARPEGERVIVFRREPTERQRTLQRECVRRYRARLRAQRSTVVDFQAAQVERRAARARTVRASRTKTRALRQEIRRRHLQGEIA